MADALTAVDVARRLADVLERAAIPYAIGGALALAYFAPPRATVDVDINIFLPPATALPRILDALTAAGFVADSPDTVAATAMVDGQFRGRLAGIRVDVFVPAIAFYAEIATRTVQVPMLGRPIDILGPQDLLTLKMMFFRRKDLADVEAVLRHPPAGVSLDEIRANLVAMVGEDDERVVEWDSLLRDVGL